MSRNPNLPLHLLALLGPDRGTATAITIVADPITTANATAANTTTIIYYLLLLLVLTTTNCYCNYYNDSARFPHANTTTSLTAVDEERNRPRITRPHPVG